MPFVAPNGKTEEPTSPTAQLMGTTVHYHEAGSGPPLVLLHSTGPGCADGITWQKLLAAFAKHFHCIAMDLPNYAKTGPIVYEVQGSVHKFQAEMPHAVMDHAGIGRAHIVGNSQGGETAMELAWVHPE